MTLLSTPATRVVFASLAVAVAFVALRTATLSRCVEPAIGEVCEFGLLADHASSGRVLLPLPEYVPLPREVGALPQGLFCAPLFAVFGSSSFALRLGNVLWHGVTALLFALLAGWLVGWRGALLFGGLWSLCPPLLSELQQFGWPSHLEMVALVAAGFLGVVVAASRTALRVPGSLLGGLSAGLAVAYAYSALPMALCLAVGVEVAHRRGLGPARWPFLAGLIAGVAPAIVYRLGWTDSAQLWQLSDGRPLQFFLVWTGEYWQPATGGLRSRLADLLTHQLMGSWGFGDGDSPGTGGWIYTAGVTAMASVGVARWWPAATPLRRLLVIVALACIATYLITCAVSGIEIQTRYLSPVAPFALLAASCCAALPLKRGGRPAMDTVLALTAAAVVLVLGARVQWWDLTEPSTVQLDGHVRGYRYADAVRTRIAARGTAAVLDAAQRHAHQRMDLLRIPGWALGGPRNARSWWTSAQDVAVELPAAAHPLFWEGAGEALFPQQPLAPSARAELNAALALVDREISGPDAEKFAFGLGFGAPHRQLDHGTWSAVMAELPAAARPAMCAGRGALEMDRRYGLFSTDIDTLAAGLPGCTAETVAVGIGVQLARETLPDRPWPGGTPALEDWMADVPRPELQAACDCAYRAENEYLDRLANEPWRDLDGSPSLQRCL